MVLALALPALCGVEISDLVYLRLIAHCLPGREPRPRGIRTHLEREEKGDVIEPSEQWVISAQ